MKLSKKIACMISIFVILALYAWFLWCYINPRIIPMELDETKYSLHIEITPEKNSTYLVYAPIFILKNGSISIINNDFLIISGSAELSVINTSYGYVLSINSSQKVVIQLNGTRNPDFELDNNCRPEIYLSLEKNNTRIWEMGPHYYWLYMNSSELNKISIKIIAQAYGLLRDGGMVTIVRELSNGWNICEGEMIKIYGPG